MTSSTPQHAGKILYGLLFSVLLPTLLFAWAYTTEPIIRVPALDAPIAGIALASIGAITMLAGMAALVHFGKGLPMNAYPPVQYVTQGVYQLLPHPIYTGFCALCLGVSVATASASGLWLITPTLILGCAALVVGYERHDLQQRFPNTVHKPLISLPSNNVAPATALDKLSVYILVFLPWLALYQLVILAGIPTDAITAFMPFEQHIPVYERTELLYAGTYLFVLIAPVYAVNRRDIRHFAISGLLASGIIFLLFFTVPITAPPRPFQPESWLGILLQWERSNDTAAAAFPSFHVVWACIAARLYERTKPSARTVWWMLAAGMALSCITTGMHSIADVAAGIIVFLFIDKRRSMWQRVRRSTERIANSWQEWHIGKVRIINHGLYAGAGAFIGLSIAGILLGSDYIPAMLITTACIIAAAALWAQLVEGSPSLLRPFGWYGGLLGALLGAFISVLTGASPLLLLAAFCVGVPWVQAAGRLRCLVQGCCHGRPTSAQIGICYTHPRSRVCRLSQLSGVPVHATPLYSILWNIVIAFVMARLWSIHTPASFIVGVYLVLGGIGRFVEEAYRGEPQTATYAGLRLYQWLAAFSVLIGIFLTTLVHTPLVSTAQWHWSPVAIAFVCGIATTAALGIDFPNSTRRFARLT